MLPGNRDFWFFYFRKEKMEREKNLIGTLYGDIQLYVEDYESRGRGILFKKEDKRNDIEFRLTPRQYKEFVRLINTKAFKE